MLRFAFLGDSITEGAGASDHEHTYTALLCKMAGAKELNYGLSGTRIARQKAHNGNPDEDFIIRAKWMDRDLDFLIVFGGTNDFGHGDAPLGTLGDETPYTFYGAMHTLCSDLLHLYHYPKEKILFLLPIPYWNENGGHGDGRKPAGSPSLEEYRIAMKEVLQEFEIDFLEITGLPKTLPQGPSEYSFDGLHPNDKGHQIIAEELFAYWQKKRDVHQ